MILAFHQIQNSEDGSDLQGVCKFVYPLRGQVDEMYNALEDLLMGRRGIVNGIKFINSSQMYDNDSSHIQAAMVPWATV